MWPLLPTYCSTMCTSTSRGGSPCGPTDPKLGLTDAVENPDGPSSYEYRAQPGTTAKESPMSNEYLASVVWQRATMSERERRDYEEAIGRLAANWSRRVDRALRTVRIRGSSRRDVVAARGSTLES